MFKSLSLTGSPTMAVTRPVSVLVISMAISLVLSIPALVGAQTVSKMPSEVGGKVPPPSGQIAFINAGDVYIMNVNGDNQTLAVASGNAVGRLSWSPDNREIVFARRGEVNFSAPDNLGGKHRVYDLFKVIMDSVGINSQWWNRITEDLGSRYPEWVSSDKIIFAKDFNARLADATLPNYQLLSCDAYGASLEPLRKDYLNLEFMSVNPTAGPNGSYAFILFDMKPMGLVVVQEDDPLLSAEEVIKRASKIPFAIAPSWSPDGKWIAYVRNDLTKPGIYLISPDGSQKYLLYRPRAGVVVSTNSPSWSPDSKWLTFATGDGAIWICDLTGSQLKSLIPSGLNISPSWSK